MLTVLIFVVLLAAAAALTAVGATAVRGRLPRNRWVGVRVPATLASEEAFRLGNRVAAIPMLAGAALLVVASAATLGLHGGLRPTAVLLCLLGTAGMVVAGGVLGARAAARVPEGAPDRCASCTGCALTTANG